MRNVRLITARGRDRSYGGIAISTDERACVLIRMLRPAIRGGTGRFCSHAHGNIRESKSVPTLGFRPGEKWLLYEDRFLYLSLFAARFNLLALWLMISGDLSDAFSEMSGELQIRQRTPSERQKYPSYISYISRFSNTRTRLHSRSATFPFSLHRFFYLWLLTLCFTPWIFNLTLLSLSREFTCLRILLMNKWNNSCNKHLIMNLKI